MRNLYIGNQTLTVDKKDTFLTTDVSSGGSTLTVKSIVGFAINKIICIGEIGEENSEIVKTHTSTSPSGTTITLLSALTFSHNRGTKVYIIDYDQIEISWSATATGTKTVLETISIQSDQNETIYSDTSQTTGYYFSRFKDSINTRYSDYSDSVPYTGYVDNTVYMIKKRALDSVNEKIEGIITHEFLNEALWQARREYHNAPGKRPFRMKYNVDLGNVVAGQYNIAVPSDLENPSTSEHLFGIRIGTEENMSYMTKKEFDNEYQGVAHGVLLNIYATASGYVSITNSGDFEDSGSIQVENDTIEYSVNDLAGSLTVDTAGTAAHDAGLDVWQNVSLGNPQKFTIFPDSDRTNKIYFDVPISNDYVNENIWADYYSTVVAYDSDADQLDEPEYDFYVNYLAYRIKKRKNPDLKADTDSDYIEWQIGKANALETEKLGQEISFIPDVSHLDND